MASANLKGLERIQNKLNIPQARILYNPSLLSQSNIFFWMNYQLIKINLLNFPIFTGSKHVFNTFGLQASQLRNDVLDSIRSAYLTKKCQNWNVEKPVGY